MFRTATKIPSRPDGRFFFWWAPTQAELGWGIRFVSELTSCAAVLTDGLDLCRRDVEEF